MDIKNAGGGNIALSFMQITQKLNLCKLPIDKPLKICYNKIGRKYGLPARWRAPFPAARRIVYYNTSPVICQWKICTNV